MKKKKNFRKIFQFLLPIILIIVIIISILLIILSIKKKKTAKDIINDMGLGWNLGNTFECYNTIVKIKDPDDQITNWGNLIPTKKMVTSIKKYGFKTVRLPVTWMNFMDSYDNVDSEWISRVKEVVKWITKSKMYCILNVHHDGVSGNWLSEGLKVKNKYINLWSQIAKEFKDFNEYLIFESMNEVEYKKDDGQYDYLTLLIMNQAFVDTIRNSGGKNNDRLLLISGMKGNPLLTCNPEYVIPIDPMNKFAICFNYFVPEQFTNEEDDDPYSYENTPLTQWGTREDYETMFINFESVKNSFLEKGIPVVINQIGVLTEQKKEPKSIREYLFTEFSMTFAYDGIVSCLWDTSKKIAGNMNYYDRENDKWYDDKIKNFFINLSKGKYVNPSDYYIFSNIETINSPDYDGNMLINIGKKKVLKLFFNAEIKRDYLWNIVFGIISIDINGNYKSYAIVGNKGISQKDGSYSFNTAINDGDFNDFIEISIWSGNEYIITFNYLTIEYDKNYIIFNYNEYKEAISSYIS